MTGEVLFFDFSYTEFLPVIEEAARRGARPIMNQPTMRQRLLQRGVPSRAFTEFVERDDSDYASRQARAMAQRFSQAVSSPGAASVFDVPDGNLLVSGSRDMVKQILTTAEHQLLLARVMNRLVETTDLKAVVMRSCMSAGQRVVQEIVQRRGIPVLELSHGNPPRHTALAGPVPRWDMAVFGEREKDIIVGHGADPNRIHPTGAPQWDSLYDPDVRPDKEAARRMLGLPEDQPFVVFAGSFSSGRALEFADTSLNLMWSNEVFAEALGGLQPSPLVAVRPHPGESTQKPGRLPTTAELHDYRRWFEERGIGLVHVDYDTGSLVREKAILIRAADAVVVQATSSTLVTEVLILDRPVFKFAYERGGSDSFYEPEDGVLTAESPERLREDMDRILHDPAFVEDTMNKARAALPTLNHGNDGRAVHRVVDLLERLASGRAA